MFKKLFALLLTGVLLLGCATPSMDATSPPTRVRNVAHGTRTGVPCFGLACPPGIESKNFTLSFAYSPWEDGGRLVIRNSTKKTLLVCGLATPVCLKLLSTSPAITKKPLGSLSEFLFEDLPGGGSLEGRVALADFADFSHVSGRFCVRILYDDSYANNYYASDATFLSQVGKLTSEPFQIEVANGRCVILPEIQ